MTEACTFLTISVRRSGPNATGATVEYRVNDGTATQRTDFEFAAGKLVFNSGETEKSFIVLINDDGYAEGTEQATMTLSNPTGGAVLGPDSTATLFINDNETSDSATNPIEDPSTFICQQYHDFLNRQSDPGGQAFWTNEITKCNGSETCIRNRRINVSAAFFIEEEFQRTGFFIHRLYKAGFLRRPGYVEFMTDRSRLNEGPNLDAEKKAYSEEFVQRSEFTAKYPTTQNGQEFVDALIENVKNTSGVDLTSKKGELIAEYNAGSNQTDSRARVMRKLIEYEEYKAAEFNPAFVLSEYFGYLRRDPDEGGYLFWLNVLNNKQPGNYRGMVCSFLTSKEYQERFSSIVPRTNTQCASATSTTTTVVAVTSGNKLLIFNSETPGTIDFAVNITGLQSGETILGMDFRPRTGQLFALGSTRRLYIINPSTGATTLVGSGPLSIGTGGTDYGFDFNPVADRIRIVDNADENFRVDPDTGVVTADGPLAYNAGDAHAGQNPNVVGAAYNNNIAGAQTTTLFDLDSVLDILATQNPPNSGTLNTIGAMGIDASSLLGFDIAARDNSGFASVIVTGGTTSSLYRIDLSNGAATLVGTINTTETVRDIAIRP
ncbi:MAG TPA: DUF4394 domain-containing protein [Pyrinomonadaceae bacterium]